MVFNNTRVVQARIIMQKPTGSKIEIFLLEPFYPPEYSLSFSSVRYCHWKCMTGNKRKWKAGQLEKEVIVGDIKVKLFAELINDRGLWQEIKFSWEPGECLFGSIIESAGLTPIPPYLDRAPEQVDKDRYQTVYSRFEGSVAAPTAGLHFTRELLTGLKDKGVQAGEVTLHVGAGTFLPVKSQTIDDHQMHSEHFSADTKTLEKILDNHQNITAVGTTTARTLETLYWLGVKQMHYHENPIPQNVLSQWEAGGLPGGVSVGQALEALLRQLAGENKQQLVAKTQLMIIPGYNFKLVNRLITNFHQPRSTLLLLIAAFIGEDWRRVYRYALDNDFRFLSYGDSSLLIPGTS
jgi:S-adenosylmethionine:tRNA ribosyltransferase-isomerase